MEPRQIHVLRGRRCMQPTKNQPNSIRMCRLDSRTCTTKKQSLEATVLESSDHGAECNPWRYRLQGRLYCRLTSGIGCRQKRLGPCSSLCKGQDAFGCQLHALVRRRRDRLLRRSCVGRSCHVRMLRYRQASPACNSSRNTRRSVSSSGSWLCSMCSRST
jgi:hypothetical protein